jgi:hypothetical protein
MKTLIPLLSFFLLLVSCQKERTDHETIVSIVSVESNTDVAKNAQNVLQYFYFDNVPAIKFIKVNNINEVKLLELIDQKLKDFNYLNENISSSSKEVTCEDVRDAMLEECDNGYCCGLAQACSIAVKVAYHYNKILGKCKSE